MALPMWRKVKGNSIWIKRTVLRDRHSKERISFWLLQLLPQLVLSSPVSPVWLSLPQTWLSGPPAELGEEEGIRVTTQTV